MADDYKGWKRGPTTFGRRSRIVTPSDVAPLADVAKAVICLTGGNLSIIPAENGSGNFPASVDFVGVPAGFIPPFQVKQVKASGTTATVATIEG